MLTMQVVKAVLAGLAFQGSNEWGWCAVHLTHPSRKQRAAKCAEVDDRGEPRCIRTKTKLVVVDVPLLPADVEIYKMG